MGGVLLVVVVVTTARAIPIGMETGVEIQQSGWYGVCGEEGDVRIGWARMVAATGSDG